MTFDSIVKEVSQAIDAVRKSAAHHKLKVPLLGNGYKGYLILHSVKGAAVFGVERGHGMAFRVVNTLPDGTQELSPPVLVKLTKFAVGLQFGYNSVNSLVMLPTDAELTALTAGSEFILGKDLDISGMPTMEDQTNSTIHKTSITAVNDGARITPVTLSVSDSLMVCDISLYGGALSVDQEAMRSVYGESYGSPLDVLQGKVALPESHKAAVAAISVGLESLVPRMPSA